MYTHPETELPTNIIVHHLNHRRYYLLAVLHDVVE